MIQWDMLKKPAPEQTALEMVTLDSLVPKDHLLRKIDAVIDFSFVHDRVAGLYCADNGRPPFDPTCMFKALFLGYLFGVRSERQLVREIEVNVAYRWFLRMKLTDPVFDASTLSQNRRRRFNDPSVAQHIFDAIVEQAIRHGLIDCTALYTDSTYLKANANKGKYDLEMLAKSRADYWADLDRAIEMERMAHGQKSLKEKEREPEVKETKVSRTDPEAGYMVRDGKPKGFFYLDDRRVDGRQIEVRLRARDRRLSLPGGPIAHLCHHRPQRQQALPLGPLRLPRLSASCFLHFKFQGRADHHSPCLGRCPRAHRRPSQDSQRQGDS